VRSVPLEFVATQTARSREVSDFLRSCAAITPCIHRPTARRRLPSDCAFRAIGYLPAMTSTEVIEQIGQRLARAAPPNSRVVLFGSHARGNADADADFDVLVIEPTVGDVVQEAVRLRSELDELEVPVDLIVMDEAKAEQRAVERGTMVARALREGRLLAQT
jgi:predicted nucleotidyltransferase